MTIYDAVFITNLPAFYKINLYEQLSKKLKIAVIFVGEQSVIRAEKFSKSTQSFNHYFLYNGPYEDRKKSDSLIKLSILLKKLSFNHLVLGGWDLPEYWLAWLLCSKKKLSVCLESGLGESQTKGVRGSVKRLFLKKINQIFASGKPHEELLNALGFNGKIIISHGVGLINQSKYLEKKKKYQGHFLYLGRFSEEKNLERLINAFAQTSSCHLTLIGHGPLLNTLLKQAPSNVTFKGPIDNNELNKIFNKYDGLILPSIKEPWGLVIEEAIYYKTPVIVSERAGIAKWVIKHQLGLTIDPEDTKNMIKVITSFKNHYEELSRSVNHFDYTKHQLNQIDAYQSALCSKYS